MQPIEGWQAWDLDHTDDRTAYLGPAHQRCNRSEGALKRNKARGIGSSKARGFTATDRDW